MNEFEAALAKSMKFCSNKEVCIFDLKAKFKIWNIPSDYYNKIIDLLIDEKFIDEQRYALAFSSDKFKFNNWGKRKISFELSRKNIPKKIISISIENIDKDEYYSVAQKLISSKLKSIKETDTYKIQSKILNFMANKGFEAEVCVNILNKLTN